MEIAKQLQHDGALAFHVASTWTPQTALMDAGLIHFDVRMLDHIEMPDQENAGNLHALRNRDHGGETTALVFANLDVRHRLNVTTAQVKAPRPVSRSAGRLSVLGMCMSSRVSAMSRSRVGDGMKVIVARVVCRMAIRHGYKTHLLLARFTR